MDWSCSDRLFARQPQHSHKLKTIFVLECGMWKFRLDYQLENFWRLPSRRGCDCISFSICIHFSSSSSSPEKKETSNVMKYLAGPQTAKSAALDIKHYRRRGQSIVKAIKLNRRWKKCPLLQINISSFVRVRESNCEMNFFRSRTHRWR